MEKTNREGFTLVLAPTGKAALNVGGATLASTAGLSTPTKNVNSIQSCRYASGSQALIALLKRLNYLGRIQPREKECVAEIIDEYSMTSGATFYWASDRVQQITGVTDEAFGGLPTLITGDSAQFLPVGGSALRDGDNLKNGPSESGHHLYKSITTVMGLTKVRRQSGEYRDFLWKLRSCYL